MAKILFESLEERVRVGLLSQHLMQIELSQHPMQIEESDADEAAALTGSSRSARTSGGSAFGKFFRLPSSKSIASITSDESGQPVYINEVTAEKLPGKRLCPSCTVS